MPQKVCVRLDKLRDLCYHKEKLNRKNDTKYRRSFCLMDWLFRVVFCVQNQIWRFFLCQNKTRTHLFHCWHCLLYGIWHDHLQHRACKWHVYQSYLSGCADSYVGRIRYHLFAGVLRGRRHCAKACFWVVQPGDRPICIIFAIQTFTVILMVAFASVIGLFHAHGFSANVIPNYIVTYCKNFIIALPLQLILVGSLARFLFRHTLLKCRKDV